MTQPMSEAMTQSWRQQGAAPSGGIDLVGRVASVAAQRPDAIAVVAPGATLTYAQLWGRALALARRLRAATMSIGDPVALCLPRSAELVVGALGIVAAGGCYVALDPSQPEERLRFMVHDSGAQLVVTNSASTYGLPADRAVAPPADDEYAGVVDTWPVAEVDPHAPAYVVYTSGSTGEPKGVLVEHASVGNLVAWHQRAFGLTAQDRSTQLASPGFDASIWEVWPCLTAGASLHIPDEALKTDPGALRDWLVAAGITVCFLPTPLAEAVCQLEWPSKAPLRFMLTGGDVLHRRPPPGLPFTLVNNYGVAEATVVATSGVVPPSAVDGRTRVRPSMGVAIDGIQLEIVDEAGQPVPSGTAGELVIGGVSVARGYLHRPEFDRTKFRNASSPMRTYWTGDRVRLQAGGELEYLGRVDDQIQLRGFRIELGEIDGVLNQHPSVQASAVVVDDEADAQFLTAYVVGKQGTVPDPSELRTHAATHLPEHMVPRDFVMLASLPTTVNGKVDRHALHIAEPRAAGCGPLAAPRNDFERSIATIVAERLALPEVGVNENFFMLGGHSMLGAQLIIRISEQFGVEMSLRSLFEHPTVAEMAEEVERLLVEDIATMTDEELLAAAQLDGETEP